MHKTTPTLLHELVGLSARQSADDLAVVWKQQHIRYAELAEQIHKTALGLRSLGLQADERVAIYLPKQPETVAALFGTAAAGGVFVPVNPLLKAPQVSHILQDCNVRVLVTSGERADLLAEILPQCRDLHTLVIVGERKPTKDIAGIGTCDWQALQGASEAQLPRRIDTDMAAILYTSGSTGHPKGVVLSHRNMVAGALSVAEYLKNQPHDRLLAVLPFSFDYGLSQLTTAFSVGASVVLMDYLLPGDVIKAVARHRVTGLAGVPPLWTQLSRLQWPAEAAASLRYITNSGGAMPVSVTRILQQALPDTEIYLMYGLTEAFRSTYLPPNQIDKRPESMGKPIPNARVLVVREDGSECAPGEPGELVHCGSLVAMGYWNDPARTAERFRPAPGRPDGLPLDEVAVWSGDQVKYDEEGYLYFVSRKDEMIKTSGYRVSPTEVEEAVYASGLVTEAIAIGAPHPDLGQAIAVLAVAPEPHDPERLIAHCRQLLPGFMVPQAVVYLPALPRNQNGKIDRKALAAAHAHLFQD